MDWIVFLIAIFSVKGTVLACTVNTFIRNDSLSNIIPSDTTPIIVNSATGCARACGLTASCTGLYFSAHYQQCILYVGDIFITFTSDSSASYHYKTATSSTTSVKPQISTTIAMSTTPTISTATTVLTSTTTSTPTFTTTSTSPPISTTSSEYTAVSFTNCSTNFMEDILLLGSSGSYHLKIVHQGVSFTQANDFCQNSGMNLFRPNDEDKVNTVVDFLNSCTGYDADGYWTDAEKQIGEAGQPWKNSDGSEVVLGAWCNNVAGYHSYEYCARLNKFSGCNYKLSDIGCGYTSYSTWGFICE